MYVVYSDDKTASNRPDGKEARALLCCALGLTATPWKSRTKKADS